MGMDADIICIGPFSRDILDCLNYDAEDCKGIEEGRLVSITICHCNTTDQSHELARCFKNLDPQDFNTHHITEDRVQWISLSMMYFDADGCRLHTSKHPLQWQRLEILLNRGFTCIYQPNY